MRNLSPLALDNTVWPLFYQMTQRGLLVSLDRVDALHAEVSELLEEQYVMVQVYTESPSDAPINPSSGDQVAAWMASEGFSGKVTKVDKRLMTDERSLRMHEHPAIDAILEYRGLRKLAGTFLEPLREAALRDPHERAHEGVVHPRWRLTKVRSGRVAMEDPNLLAFPSRDDLGKKVRACFIARPGYSFVSVDFSQLEPRVVAALSKDPKLLAVYAEGRDLYAEIAKDLGVTRLMAKIITLGVLYGMGAQRLKEQLALASQGDFPVEQCQDMIDRWFNTYVGVKQLVHKILTDTRKADGWVYTEGGRGRLLPGVFLDDRGWLANKVREEAERQAFNHVIQGTGMEQLKYAMIDVSHQREFEAHMLLAIHDELVFEVRTEHANTAALALGKCMERDFYGVRLSTNSSVAQDWGGLK